MTSSKGFRNGKNTWQIKLNGGWCHPPHVGIVTIWDCVSKGNSNLWIDETETGIAYYYFAGKGGDLCRSEGGAAKKLKTGCGDWKKDTTVTFCLDLDEGKFTVWSKDKELGSVKVEKGCVYHPALNVCACKDEGDFKLITL